MLGICVLNWNAGESLIYCLQSVEKQRLAVPVRVVVVDNASSDDSVRLVREKFAHISIIENEQNLGYATGNNVGAQYLLREGCDHLVFLNPDVMLESDSLLKLISSLSVNARIGCAGGVPRTPPGKFDAPARTRPSLLEKVVTYGPLWRVPFLNHLCRKHLRRDESLADGEHVYAVYGACIAFRSEAFQNIGGFDQSTFLYEEEFITAEKLRDKGWLTVLCLEAKYAHTVGGSTQRIPYRRRLYFIASEQYLLRRYYRYDVLSRRLIWLYRLAEWLLYCLYSWAATRFANARFQGLAEKGPIR